MADNNVDRSESKSETGQSEDRINKSHETVMLMPEYLVVCCWRSVKEISLILGQLTKDVPVGANDEDSSRLLTHRQVSDFDVDIPLVIVSCVAIGVILLQNIF